MCIRQPLIGESFSSSPLRPSPLFLVSHISHNQLWHLREGKKKVIAVTADIQVSNDELKSQYLSPGVWEQKGTNKQTNKYGREGKAKGTVRLVSVLLRF